MGSDNGPRMERTRRYDKHTEIARRARRGIARHDITGNNGIVVSRG
jgi:hypothetical protein